MDRALSAELIPRDSAESDYGWIAGFTSPKCTKESIVIPGSLYLDTATCSALNIAQDTIGINWGTNGARVPCGVDLYKDEDCQDFAVGTWKPGNGSCISVVEHGGPFRGIRTAACYDG
ncbi:hypothetical protein ACLMJK_004749 [Lecanora helva]